MSSIKQALVWGAGELKEFPTARLDAEILLMDALDLDRTTLYTYPENRIEADQEATYKQFIARRRQGEPVAYIMGQQEFWSLDLEVTPDVLIPRADTELLVELALEKGGKAPKTVIDLGTGSGAIALALKLERQQWDVFALDCSKASLDVAKRNCERYQAKISMIQGLWLNSFKAHSFDLVVSNPPYIDPEDPHLNDLTFEPKQALIAQQQGLADLVHLAKEVPKYLKTKGWLMMEHGFQQAQAVQQALNQAGFSRVKTFQDLAGHDRVTIGQV